MRYKKASQMSVELILSTLIVLIVIVAAVVTKDKQDNSNIKTYNAEDLKEEAIRISERLLTPQPSRNDMIQKDKPITIELSKNNIDTTSNITIYNNTLTLSNSFSKGNIITPCLTSTDGALNGIRKEKTNETLNGQTIKYYIDQCNNNWTEFTSTKVTIAPTKKYRIKTELTSNLISYPRLQNKIMLRIYYDTSISFDEYLSMQNNLTKIITTTIGQTNSNQPNIFENKIFIFKPYDLNYLDSIQSEINKIDTTKGYLRLKPNINWSDWIDNSTTNYCGGGSCLLGDNQNWNDYFNIGWGGFYEEYLTLPNITEKEITQESTEIKGYYRCLVQRKDNNGNYDYATGYILNGPVTSTFNLDQNSILSYINLTTFNMTIKISVSQYLTTCYVYEMRHKWYGIINYTSNATIISKCNKEEDEITNIKISPYQTLGINQSIYYYIDKCDYNWQEIKPDENFILNSYDYRIRADIKTNNIQKTPELRDINILLTINKSSIIELPTEYEKNKTITYFGSNEEINESITTGVINPTNLMINQTPETISPSYFQSNEDNGIFCANWQATQTCMNGAKAFVYTGGGGIYNIKISNTLGQILGNNNYAANDGPISWQGITFQNTITNVGDTYSFCQSYFSGNTVNFRQPAYQIIGYTINTTKATFITNCYSTNEIYNTIKLNNLESSQFSGDFYFDKCDGNWFKILNNKEYIFTNFNKYRIKLILKSDGCINSIQTTNPEIGLKYKNYTTTNTYTVTTTTQNFGVFKEKNKIYSEEFLRLKNKTYEEVKGIIGTNKDFYLRIRDQNNNILNEYGKSCQSKECYSYKRLIYYDDKQAYLEVGVS